jgi:hypothetical protein
MHPLFNTLLDATSHWLDGLSSALATPADGRVARRADPAVRTARQTLADACTPRHGAPMRVYSPPAPAAERNHISLARTRILEARARLNPTRRLPRMRSAPDDACRTVISGRLGDVCDLLDQLVAREAARR